MKINLLSNSSIMVEKTVFGPRLKDIGDTKLTEEDKIKITNFSGNVAEPARSMFYLLKKLLSLQANIL